MAGDYTVQINWDNAKREDFDEIVEGLIFRSRSGDGRVEVVNGRGGDGGRDIVVHLGDGGSDIYQLKFFPEGFSGGFTRKRQIKESFETAMKLKPTRWILVVPANLTVRE